MVSIKTSPLREATLIERVNRFLAVVDLAGLRQYAHVPNSGRLRELLFPGNCVLVTEKAKGNRKTCWEIVMATHPSGQLVSVDTRIPNDLVFTAIRLGVIPELVGYRECRREYVFGSSRFDFLLSGDPHRSCLLEVKSVTLVERGVARFPDAPTTRGTMHLTELSHAVENGYRCVVLFLIQRDDAVKFSANYSTDPLFAKALREAFVRGVEAYAYRCSVSPGIITLEDSVPVVL